MTMEFNQESGIAARAGNPAAGVFDWHGLRARLAATFAVRSALQRGSARRTVVAGGSFDRGSARILAVFGRDLAGGLDAINPTALGSGKFNDDNDAAVADAHAAGD